MRKIKILVITFAIALQFLLPHLASAANLPCTPTVGQDNSDLFSCINNLYKYALIISSIAAVFMIMLGGYLYIFSGGSTSKVSTAKSFIWSSLLGIVVLLAGFLLLKQINPSLLTVKSVTPTQSPLTGWLILEHGGGGGGGGGGGTGGGGSGRCEPSTRPDASVAALSGTCFGANATKASSIANLESGGVATARGDKCADGSYASWGLFQINISANPIAGLNCKDAFDRPASGRTLLSNGTYDCHVINQTLYAQCIAAAQIPANNIQAACAISHNGTRWSAWSTNRTCNF